MAKKPSKAPKVSFSLKDVYYIYTRYADTALLPTEAIDPDYLRISCVTDDDVKLREKAMFKTIDNVYVSVTLVSCMNNADNYFVERLEDICQELYKMSFMKVRSHWYARFGYLNNYWHIVKMKPYGT